MSQTWQRRNVSKQKSSYASVFLVLFLHNLFTKVEFFHFFYFFVGIFECLFKWWDWNVQRGNLSLIRKSIITVCIFMEHEKIQSWFFFIRFLYRATPSVYMFLKAWNVTFPVKKFVTSARCMVERGKPSKKGQEKPARKSDHNFWTNGNLRTGFFPFENTGQMTSFLSLWLSQPDESARSKNQDRVSCHARLVAP